MNNTFLTIKEPCNQGWDNMSVSEKGKFCSACQKQVYDFSNATLDEIKKVYAESKDGLCGHVPAKLLRDQYVAKELQKSHYSYLKKFCLAAILCFGANLFTVDAAKASTFYKVKMAFLNIATVPNNDTVYVKGIVQDKTNRERIPFSVVCAMVNDSIIAKSTTNFEGEYSLKVPVEYSNVDVKVVCVGYITKVFKGVAIAKGKQIVVDFDLQRDETMFDGIMIIEEPPLIDQSPGPSGKTIKREEYQRMPK